MNCRLSILAGLLCFCAGLLARPTARIEDLMQGIDHARNYRFDQALLLLEKYGTYIDSTHAGYAECERWIEFSKKGQKYIRRVEDIALIDSVRLSKKDWLWAYNLSGESGKLTEDDSLLVFTNARGDRMVREILQETDSGVVQRRLVRQERLLTEWTDPDTIPELLGRGINMRHPFMLSDGVTLYFTSDSEVGIGNYDIFVTRYNHTTGTWLTPENIGFPFNSVANDYMFAVDEQRNIGMFMSDRFTDTDSATMYSFVLNKQKHVLRDTTEDYIRQAAMLKVSRIVDEEQMLVVGQNQENVQLQLSNIRFVINDSIVYEDIDDFENEEARRLAEEYVLLSEQLTEEKTALQRLRDEYMVADDNRRSELSNVIMVEEKTVRRIETELKHILKQVVKLENEYR